MVEGLTQRAFGPVDPAEDHEVQVIPGAVVERARVQPVTCFKLVAVLSVMAWMFRSRDLLRPPGSDARERLPALAPSHADDEPASNNAPRATPTTVQVEAV
jgi:hypothetical protein